MTKLKSELFAAVALVALRPFENKAGWKLDADGKIEMKDGNPVWVNANGQEQVLEANTVAKLNGEAKVNRERAEKAEAALKPFEGLDAAAARKALDTVSKIDAKALIDAGEVDKVKDEIAKTYQAQITERDKSIADLTSSRDNLIKENGFAQSEFIRDRIAVPPDMFRAYVGGNFKVEEGKLVPYDSTGSKIFSQKRIGEVASVDEALEILVNQHPNKDTILRAEPKGGTGSGGGGGGRGGSRIVRRSDFDAMTPADKAATAQAMGKGEVQVVD